MENKNEVVTRYAITFYSTGDIQSLCPHKIYFMSLMQKM